MPKRVTRNISLTPQMDKFVSSLVKSGEYESASEVMRDAVRALRQRQQVERRQAAAFYAMVDQGLASLDAGRVVDGDAFMADWLARGAGAEKQKRRRRSA